jgi:hypothetical protein
MCAYCMARSHMTLSKALRCIQVARVARRHPVVFALIADGRLGLTTLSELAPALRDDNATELLAESAFKTKEEIRRLLVERARKAASPPATKPTVTNDTTPNESADAEPAPSLADLGAPPASDNASGKYAPAHTGMTRRGRISPSSSGDYDVRLSITEQERAVLRRAEDLLGHAVPSGDPAEIYARAMEAYVELLEKKRFGAKRSASVADAVTKSRQPTREMRGFVEERDGGRCTFVGPDGHRCEETRGLECDHKVPWAEGGPTTPSNLRLLCKAHNQLAAEQAFGKEYIESRREIAERERAKGRMAAKASEQRPQVRSEERQAIFNDLVGGLCNLGYSEAKARAAAELADTLPNAALEECMAHVLKAIGRECKHHGDRLARCSP